MNMGFPPPSPAAQTFDEFIATVAQRTCCEGVNMKFAEIVYAEDGVACWQFEGYPKINPRGTGCKIF